MFSNRCGDGPKSDNTSGGELASDRIWTGIVVVDVFVVSRVSVAVSATTLHTRSAETSGHTSIYSCSYALPPADMATVNFTRQRQRYVFTSL